MLIRTLKLLLPFADYQPTETKLLQNKVFAISKGHIERFKKHYVNADGQKKESFEYPLVNFRSENGKGVLFALNEGIDDLRLFYEKLNDKPVLKPLPALAQWRETFHHVGLTPQSTIYRVFHCALLNSTNYENYQHLDSGYKTELEQTIFLENILSNQIINFCNAMQYQFPKGQLWVRILDFEELGFDTFHTDNAASGKVPFLVFNITFRTNILLPDEISLGKEKAIGWGIVRKLT
ncbi:MAG: CRISPR-associated endonuclease Cas6 [Arcicella sp.]|jgi:hypothetical protein|nr:CRISPR-associated endonuclease Cas6 [Arcicella sp.]